MDNMSDKAKVVYATLQLLDATNKDNKVNAYIILDYIIEEADDLREHELVKDIPEQDFMDITIDINIKGINTIITSLAKKGLVVKTEPVNMKVEGITRSLRQYYLQK